MISAVLFDLDNTLSDYAKSVDQSLDEAADYAVQHNPELTVLGLKEAYHRSREELEEEAARLGEGLYARRSGVEVRHLIWERALQRCGVSNALLARAVAARYGLARAQTISLLPDATPVLSQLKSHYRLGLIVNGPGDIQREQIKVLNIGAFFVADAIVIEGEVGYGKPTAAIFQLAAEKIECEVGRAAFVGDSLREDVAGAQEAGMRAVWVNSSSACLSPGDPDPDAQVERLTALPEVIEHLPQRRTARG